MAITTYLFISFPETYRINALWDLALPTSVAPAKDNSSSISSETVEQAHQPQQLDADENNEKDIVIEKSENEKTAAPSAPVGRPRINPIAPFLMLRHPFIFISSIISGLAFGCMFAVETIIPGLYETHYGFNSWQTGISISRNFFRFIRILILA